MANKKPVAKKTRVVEEIVEEITIPTIKIVRY